MEGKRFVFQISPYDVTGLLAQTSRALEARTELISRERYPRLWKKTDQLNSTPLGRSRSKRRVRNTSILYLALGLFLFVPGFLRQEELSVAMFAGAFAIAYGLGGLWSVKKQKSDPFEQAAKTLLEGKDAPLKADAEVSFSEEGMHVPTKLKDEKCVPYGKMECVIETADAYLLTYDTRVTLLQKSDLIQGTDKEFRSFIKENVARYRSVA